MLLALSAVLSSSGFSNGMMIAEAFPHARMQVDQVALGGIPLGATMNQVKSVYGEPATREEKAGGSLGRVITWNYGGTYIIKFSGESHRVISEQTTANNGIKLPSGIGVGDNISRVKNYNQLTKISAREYRVDVMGEQHIYFKADRNGKICSIEIYL